MKRQVTAAVIVAVLAVVSARAQAPSAQPTREQILKAADDIMRAAGFCTLVTLGEDGHPRSRVMQPRAPDAGLVVWMGTNPLSRKVGEIERDPRVTLSYFDRAGNRYVTLFGRAAVVRGAEERAKYWTEDWNAFYKDKHRGDDFILLKVTPSRLEIVSARDGIVNDRATWRPVSIDLIR